MVEPLARVSGSVGSAQSACVSVWAGRGARGDLVDTVEFATHTPLPAIDTSIKNEMQLNIFVVELHNLCYVCVGGERDLVDAVEFATHTSQPTKEAGSKNAT